MPVSIAYESVPRDIQYETDADGTLHIVIPPYRPGILGISLGYWAIILFAPPSLTLATLVICRDADTIEMAFLVGVAMMLFMIIFGLSTSAISRTGKFKTWIDATSQQLTISHQTGASVSSRSFSGDRLRALTVVGESSREQISWYREWRLRIYGRYEWEMIFEHYSQSSLEEIADRLRTQLQIPKEPPVAANAKVKRSLWKKYFLR